MRGILERRRNDAEAPPHNGTVVMDKTQFTVDAALLRELGERLIGRAHIALAELVKNAYDADAHTCRIEIERNRITVLDDGHGISKAEFFDYWMRIGTTHKVDARVSRSLERSMTGSKGLGRLSTQFLANEMELESTSTSSPERTLYAVVDWSTIRSGEDLQTVDVEWESRAELSRYADDARTGTRITLSGLKTGWDSAAVGQLGRAVWMLRSPFKAKDRPRRGKTALDFYIDLSAPNIGDAKAQFDRMHDALFGNWKAKISGSLEGGRRPRARRATVRVDFVDNYPDKSVDAKSFTETVDFPVRRQGSSPSDEAEPGSALDEAQFEVLVFKTEGRQPDGMKVGEMRDYLRQYGNVSVYDGGFRLPYYGSEELAGQDWLDVALDQGRRLTASELLPERLRTKARYLLDLPNPGRIFGAVEVNTNHEHAVAPDGGQWLQIQPGRDRLAPNRPYEQLKDFVRFALDFYANRYRVLADQTVQRERAKEPPVRAFQRALATLDRNKVDIPKEAYSEIRRDVLSARRAVETEQAALDSRAVLLAPLATAGMAALALNHEMARDSTSVADAITSLRELATTLQRTEITDAIEQLERFVTRFNAYRQLFAPLAEPEDREATRRFGIRSFVQGVIRDIRPRMPNVRFDVSNVPRDLHFPVGAFVEWSAVLQNLLFNAWDAMLDADYRLVMFEGGVARRRQYLRVSDTGTGLAVPIEDAAQLFEPFERRTEVSDANRSLAIGGQGLGLAIVRMIAQSRSVDVRFVPPRRGHSTTIELSWRG